MVALAIKFEAAS